jgi:hypothetical protein
MVKLGSTKKRETTMEHLDSTKVRQELAAVYAQIRPFFRRSESFHTAQAYLEALSFSPL